jgi:hypothetical protein
MAAKERAIRRPRSFVLSLCRTVLVVSWLALPGAPSTGGIAEAQQPAPMPAPWGGQLAPPAPIMGLSDARPLLPLEFSRAWLEKVESVRTRRDELFADGRLDGMTPEQLAREGAALTGRLRIPVIPVRYSDVRVPFHEEYLQRGCSGRVGATRSRSPITGPRSRAGCCRSRDRSCRG